MILLTLSLNANANEQCINTYGLYNQDTNELLIESDSKEYLIAIEHEFNNAEVNTQLEISTWSCLEGEE